jgi:hypothetical protein
MTHRKMSTFGGPKEGGFVAAPSVVGNRSIGKGTLTDREAVSEARKRGTVSPRFKTEAEAEVFNKFVHDQPLPDPAHHGAHAAVSKRRARGRSKAR